MGRRCRQQGRLLLALEGAGRAVAGPQPVMEVAQLVDGAADLETIVLLQLRDSGVDGLQNDGDVVVGAPAGCRQIVPGR